jgi:hydrogenase nickel incorporation protein HypB
MEIKVLQDIMSTNKETASEVQALTTEKKIYMIDLMSSPGSGKTTLADKLISELKKDYKIAVIEGDIKTTRDAERLAKHDIPIVQMETERFGGDCHLESSWVRKCMNEFNLDEIDVIIVENIGNLVCPAEFELGDDERVVVLSITEGEDKPVKYPLAFNTSKTCIISKMDLLPHLDLDMDELMENLRKVNPRQKVMKISATSGEGMKDLFDHFRQNIKAKIGK